MSTTELKHEQTDRRADLFDLTGRVALVTGASRGIGAAIARQLAAHGAHVLVSSRKADTCDMVVTDILNRGGMASTEVANIGSLEDLTALFSRIKEKYGRLGILVNNAATNPYFGHVLDTPHEAFQKTIDVNLRGYFFASVEAGRLMRDGDGGSIINIASVNAVRPAAMQAVYSMTKAAVVNMTKAFAKECARLNIRVNAVLPGLTQTDFAGALFDNEVAYKSIIRQIPMHRHALPDEISGAVLYLVSDAASYTTGQAIAVEGGLLA